MGATATVTAPSITPTNVSDKAPFQLKSAVKLVWTIEETKKLADLVMPYHMRQMNIPWETIEKQMEGAGKTRSDIVGKWQCELDPTLKKGPFTPEEDAVILREHGEC